MPDRAVVWLPFSAVPAFFKKIEQFAMETTSRGAPRNQALVANIAELRLAVLRDLWQEQEPFPDPEEVRWWEVWLARFEPGRSTRNAKASDPGVSPETITASARPGSTLRAIAAEQGWPMAPGLLAFPENVIALVRTSATELGTILSTSAVPSELHRARVTSEILSVSPLDQNDFVADLAGRIKVDRTLSVLDGVQPGDEHGHGTSMAGLALFADLNRDLLGNGLFPLRHRIESVKIIRQGVDSDNDPEMYGVITAAAAAAVETEQSRQRVFSMAVTVDDPGGSDGRPKSYSAALDALAFGTDIARGDDGIELLGQPDPRAARLFVVSAGNIRHGYQVNHLDVCDLSRVQNPAQAWNALTVGAYTQLVDLPQIPIYAGWRALAEAGDLSPFSRTSTTFGRAWPVKPDIVLEGGNLLVNSSNTEFFNDPELALVTTSNAQQRLLTSIFRVPDVLAWSVGWWVIFSAGSRLAARLSRRVGGVPRAPGVLLPAS